METVQKELTVALAGNPNCGKTTLFNALTGKHNRVGNWAGVTVERIEGTFLVGNVRIHIVDLPGIYSLSPASAEEAVARDFLLQEKPDLILNIIDATNLRRNLYLTTQLAQTGIPMLLALNMMDALAYAGLDFDLSLFRQLLQLPVAAISAGKQQGITALKQQIPDACKNPAPGFSVLYPSFFTGNLCGKTKQEQFRLFQSWEQDTTYNQQLAEARYHWIDKVFSRCVHTAGKNKQLHLSRLLDHIVLHPFFSYPLFLLVMFGIFQCTFGPFGSMLSDGMDFLVNHTFAGLLQEGLARAGVSGFAASLVLNGILSGVGSIASFFPQIILLFFLLSLLEDSGYLARGALLMDRLLRKFGLSGKAFVPLLMGFGCSVPAILSTRTLEHERDRRQAILLIPFLSCGAKMPVYAMFASVFFPSHAGLIIFSLYLLGIFLGGISGILLAKKQHKKAQPLFLVELPPYRRPTPRSTFVHVLERCKDFWGRAVTVLLVASVLIWCLQNFTPSLRPAYDSSESILAWLGSLLAPLFTPCGFGDWRAAVSLLSGFAAKEAVLSSMSILYAAPGGNALQAALQTAFTPLSAYAFLVFVLLYVPCIAAVRTMYCELNSKKWTLFSICWQLGIAWFISMLFFQAGLLFC